MEQEIKELRTYNSKTFRTTKSGEFKREFHIKPIHYLAVDGLWRELDEVASYFGNRAGMTLKLDYWKHMDFNYLIWYIKRQMLIRGRGVRIGELRVPLLVNATLTAFPNPNPETTSVLSWFSGYSGIELGLRRVIPNLRVVFLLFGRLPLLPSVRTYCEAVCKNVRVGSDRYQRGWGKFGRVPRCTT